MGKIFNFVKNHIGLILVFIIGVLSVISLFHSGLPPTHDGEYHVVRFYEFDKTLRSGAWYPLWASDLNYTYGSPLFNYVYPLPNYIASFFHLTGLSFIDSFKANLIFASILGALFSYLYAKERFGAWGGIITSVFYTFAPYHFLDIYIRGEVGEVWALALFPLGLLTLDRVCKKKNTASIIFAGAVYALIIFSHNILAVMYSGFAVPYIILLSLLERKNKLKSFLVLCTPFLLGFLLSAIFFVPALVEQKYVTGLQIFDIKDSFPELFQLLIPSWGSGFSGGALGSEMSFQIGAANLLIVLTVISGLLFRKVKKEKIFILFFLLWFFVLFFLMTPNSLFIWDNISLMQNFQFPWRFLSLVILVCAVLAGSLASVFESKAFNIILVILCILTTYFYAHPPYFMERTDYYYTTHDNFIHGTNSIGDVFQTKWLGQQKALPKQPANYPLTVVNSSSINREYKINMPENKLVTFNTAYFPGWNVYIDGKKTETLNNKGLIAAQIPHGGHLISIGLEDTLVRFISKTISIVAFLVLSLTLLITAVVKLKHAHSHR